MTPAPGQGCLALEARTNDVETAELAAALTDGDALTALTAERALVVALGATCNTPVGALAVLDGESLTIKSFAGLPDGSSWIRDGVTLRCRRSGGRRPRGSGAPAGRRRGRAAGRRGAAGAAAP